MALLAGVQAYCCTNFLIGKGASADGSTMLSYNMDSYGMFTRLKVLPGFVGRKGQENPDGLLHYTCLMELALQRAATARERMRKVRYG